MMSRFFIRRPIFAGVVSIVIVIVGAVALLSLPIARYPDIAPPTIQVTATYPGADSETIAETVATPIEQEVNGVEGMIYMTSTSSSDGTMQLNVTFMPGVDLDIANVLVQNRVSIAEPRLPEEVRRLGITVKKQSSDILVAIGLVAEEGRTFDETFLNNFAFQKLRDELTRIEGVSEVVVFGAQYGMRVWLDPDRMRALGLSSETVVNAIREQNSEVASGKIGEPPTPPDQVRELTVTTTGRLSTVEQFEEMVVAVGERGQLVRLRDVGRVELGAQSYAQTSQLDDETTAVMAVYQLPGSNAIATADAVYAQLEKMLAEQQFPDGLSYTIPYDATEIIRASLSEVVVTLFITLVLVILTVYVFLQDWRATLIPAVTIPVSLVGTFIVMSALGYSLNILTLFGLVLVIGIVVDDAIVVVENTSRLIEEGKPPREAAEVSMLEVTGPVIATTLVLLAVFIPTIFMGGIVGSLFRQFAVTISIATVFSSINALTLSPALCGLLLRKRTGKPFAPLRAFNALLGAGTNAYVAFVRGGLRFAPLVIVAFIAIVGATGWAFTRTPTGFVPQEDEGYFIVNIQLPDAATLERTQEVTRRINGVLMGAPGVRDVIMINGYSFIDSSRAANTAGAIVTLENWDERTGPGEDLGSVVRWVNGQLAGVQDAFAIAITPPSLPGIGFAGGFTAQVLDRGDVGPERLAQYASELVAQGNAQSSMGGLFSTFRASVPQLFLNIDREQVKETGLSLSSVFDTLGVYLGSVYVNDFTLDGRIYQVRAQAEPEYRATPVDIERLQVRGPGGMIPLGSVMNIEETFGPTTVTHFNIYPAARINGQAMPGFSSGDAMASFEQMSRSVLPPDLGIAWTDLSFQEQAAQGGTTVIFAFSLVLVYLLLAAQYESWTVPLSVIVAVPTALAGAVGGIWLRGFDNNVYTQIGIVLLIGLAAKTAILIAEFAKQRFEAGESLRDAALSASRLRFRAVLMTAFSFILGVIPLVIASGAGAESRKVLGTVVLFGMSAATVLGIVVVPILFYVIQSMARVKRPAPSEGESGSADTRPAATTG